MGKDWIISYWDCGDHSHCHTDYGESMKCRKKMMKNLTFPKNQKKREKPIFRVIKGLIRDKSGRIIKVD